MFTAFNRRALLVMFSSCLVCSCAEIKQTGRIVGHTTRDVAKGIGHGTRDVAREIGHGTRNAVHGIGQGIHDVVNPSDEDEPN
ncbi:hypothetical protein [Methylomicrobium lacus]|uniref:hypothetical protein n=1 Tax=Methylomicrobium lacus TaxID=136992 RepID=UPI0035A8488C